MTQAWKARLPSTQKLVLLALCDSANDSGQCYPSISMMAQKCSLTDRGVQKAMAGLIAMGYYRREVRAGRSTVYQITDPRTWFTAEQAKDAAERYAEAVNDVHPRTMLTTNNVHPTPEQCSPTPEQCSPTPEQCSPITVTQTSRNRQGTVKASALPDWLPAESWAMWDRYRKSSGKGWTDDAKRLAVAKLEKLRADGHEPKSVIENAIECGWRGLYPPSTGRQGLGQPNRQAAIESANKAAGDAWLERKQRELEEESRTVDAA